MHIFLTGELQIGKSTAIQNTLKLLSEAACGDTGIGGFRTVSSAFSPLGESEVFLVGAAGRKVYTFENRIALRSRANPTPQAFPAVFDIVGCRLLRESRDCSLILMDELGFLESKAADFQKTVLECLEGTKPIVGVIRQKDTPFLNSVRKHLNVELLVVNLQNRDELPKVIAGKLRNHLGGYHG